MDERTMAWCFRLLVERARPSIRGREGGSKHRLRRIRCLTREEARFRVGAAGEDEDEAEMSDDGFAATGQEGGGGEKEEAAPPPNHQVLVMAWARVAARARGTAEGAEERERWRDGEDGVRRLTQGCCFSSSGPRVLLLQSALPKGRKKKNGRISGV